MIRIRRQPPTFLALLLTRPRLALVAAAGLLATGLALAHAREFDVKGGELRPALDAYIAQSGVQLIYKMEDVKDLSTRASGERSPPTRRWSACSTARACACGAGRTARWCSSRRRARPRPPDRSRRRASSNTIGFPRAPAQHSGPGNPARCTAMARISRTF
ncbi:hypothetical protein CKY39_26915 [Variovorax boronicumulans]|uniref:Uncharacterized protein n=1 Tax=Variovorax boronicumulans TaxID=436515 RepID=A0A250DQD6_9BURK|nr:hypothetical protein CKY39_26915 [Variovorax boronicumulans]